MNFIWRWNMNDVETIVKMCCVSECYKIYREHRDEWVFVGKPLAELVMQEYTVSHGYCPSCFKKERAKIKRRKEEMQRNNYSPT